MKIKLNDPYSVPTYTDSDMGGMTYEDYKDEIEVRKIDGQTIFLADGRFLNLFPSEYEVVS